MKRSDLIRRVRQAATANGRTWTLHREGREHDIWICGNSKVAMPRHRDINQYTAEGIFKDLEGELGESWWRKGS
jgi:hypothetical protein